MAEEPSIEAATEGDALVLRARGSWVVAHAGALDRRLRRLKLPAAERVRLDLGEIGELDTAGAWLLLRTERALAGTREVEVENLPPSFGPLFRQVETHEIETAPLPCPPTPGIVDLIAHVGRSALALGQKGVDLLGFFGLLAVTLAKSLGHPRRIRLVPFAAHIQRTGVSALPIVGLLSFLIGIVLAYQSAEQLRRAAAEVFTVDILGIGFLREFGVLLTAIIAAGRSGSAFTAEIGTMQVNEEVDAMRALGIDPVEVLVLPRLFALVVTLPLLAFYADVMGLVGGAVMCWAELGIEPAAFAEELRAAIWGWTFWIGLIKAPFFAVTIALVGCFEGLRVSRSAESVGRLTTVSVVQSIFLVIVLDAGFSFVFAKLGL